MTDLPVPYIGQTVHYVDENDNHRPAVVTAVLSIDGSRNLDPVQVRGLYADNLPAHRLGIQHSGDHHRGTWHEIDEVCAQTLTEIEKDPPKGNR